MSDTESILKCLIDNLSDGIHIVDADGKTIFYNESMGKVEGFKPEEVLGKRVGDYIEDVKEESSTLMNALKHKEKFVDVLQHYSSHYGKAVTTINTTIPVIRDRQVVAAIEISRDMTQLKSLNEKLLRLQVDMKSPKKLYSFQDIVGHSSNIKTALNKAVKASSSNSSVLIYGETGCGKELFAQSIHNSSMRRNKPFIPLNCAAIPSALLEGMLFGTVKGSFTGAENKKGLFEEANGGTMLLDEINSLEPGLQSKLLRVLQDGYIRPLGGSRTIDVDVRIIATLNELPEKLMEQGRLRKDFYYRLSVIRIDIPSLKERKEDIPKFVSYFINHYNKLLNKSIEKIDEEVLEEFLDYEWPGNIRELKNVIESAFNMCENDLVLKKEYFESKFVKDLRAKKDSEFDGSISLEDYLDGLERNIIGDALKKNENNITKTAKELKISRQNLQHKIKKHKL